MNHTELQALKLLRDELASRVELARQAIAQRANEGKYEGLPNYINGVHEANQGALMLVDDFVTAAQKDLPRVQVQTINATISVKPSEVAQAVIDAINGQLDQLGKEP